MKHKDIYWFYRWGLRVVPIVGMLSHWCLLGWVYCSPSERMPVWAGSSVYMACTYFMCYVMPFFMLPASYFMGFSWGWRIPFVYLAGVNLTRLSYGSLLALEMFYADALLVVFVMLLYGCWWSCVSHCSGSPS